MTQDIVLVPTHFRPEYLSRCLKNIFAADGIEGKEVWVCQDERVGERERFRGSENDTVLEPYLKDQRIRYVTRELHRYLGNSCNLISAYRDAYETDARYVFLVEDDVLVAKEFFQWHERVQEETGCFCSIASTPARYSMVKESNDEGYFVGTDVYSSIGVCWRRENLEQVSKLGYHNVRMHGEQDCQIKELITRHHFTIAGAYRPRAFHIGSCGTQRVFNDDRDIDRI